MIASPAFTASRRNELASLSERMGALQAMRACLVGVVFLAVLTAPDVAGARPSDLVPLAVVYIAVELAGEMLRRALGGRGLGIVGGMLLADGLFVTAVLYRTGGATSYLAFLVEVDIVAVCLLVSYRTGLKLALWYTLLFGSAHYLVAARLLHTAPTGRAVIGGFGRSEVFGILSFWLVAVATAAFSSLNERELRRSKVQLRAVAAMSADLTENLRAELVPGLLLDHVLTTFGMARGVVVLAEEKANPDSEQGPTTVEVSVTTARGREVLDSRSGRTPWPDEAAVLAAGRRAPVLLRALGPSNPLLAAALPQARNVIVLPLLAGGRSFGVLALERGGRLGLTFPARTLDLLGQFAAHAALALQTASLHAEVERLATFDALTGLHNRRVFEAALGHEVSRASRASTELGLVILDVDHFKAINDTYGHQVGDEILQHVGAAIIRAAREADVVARYGGEEFVVLLPDCDADEAVLVAERLRAAIAGGHPVPVTVSAGVAVAGGPDLDAALLVRNADDALYQSKRDGRDRTTLWGADVFAQAQRLRARRRRRASGSGGGKLRA